ncbi:hypothetical protein BDZ94DRAFT_1317593 [Collybia nuda]|uniref:UBX domain-containing protein n=1 Tax=Collybia nuda TaxID=64659 RepID=A0A9P6CJP8_9AGAR|nr:hypothetical protein BDZ94DRAFT_1317593 [Collybia nuda]
MSDTRVSPGEILSKEDINPSTEPEHEIANTINNKEPTFTVYKPSNILSLPPPPVLSDDYFTPTAADLKAAQHTLSARTQALVNAPLQLRATRDANEKAKRDRWPNTTIRIKFTDRTQLERVFPSTDKIKSVYAFVRDCLREDVKPIKFILYQSPPKRDLRVSDPAVRNLSLSELHLAPSSILLLRFESDALNGSDVSAPLRTSILLNAIDLPTPLNHDITSPSEQKVASTSGTSSAAESSGQKKIPKWLKMGIKK